MKVYITADATYDPSLWDKAKDTESPYLRYLIVHQTLVLESWVADGVTESIKNAVLRLRKVLEDKIKENNSAAVEELKQLEDLIKIIISTCAQEEGEEEEDIFIIMNPDNFSLVHSSSNVDSAMAIDDSSNEGLAEESSAGDFQTVVESKEENDLNADV